MKLGAYTACLHDKTLAEALEILAGLGLQSIELNAGGFIPAPHVPVDALLASARARREYLAQIADSGLELTGLNVNGNPLDPDPEVRGKHARDDMAYWAGFLTALRKVRPDIAVNIEHEDTELGQLEGLSLAAANLIEAARLG
ncbi:MAG TPA: hypothetical protein VF933_10355 [Streptosporangiaceae bacterium]